ncbi:Uncharacterised protein [Segatella copri]|nr:Uncharacterised protein [Segatella copri]
MCLADFTNWFDNLSKRCSAVFDEISAASFNFSSAESRNFFFPSLLFKQN